MFGGTLSRPNGSVLHVASHPISFELRPMTNDGGTRTHSVDNTIMTLLTFHVDDDPAVQFEWMRVFGGGGGGELLVLGWGRHCGR